MPTTDLDMSLHPCPSCAVDGGYGHAENGSEYLCPDCTAVWSPAPDGTTARTGIANLVQRLKVWFTSR